MTVTRLPDGRWAVTDLAGKIISTHDSNSRAWRAADRLANEPINKREDTADWLSRQQGGAA